MRILLAGASGFIGAALRTSLADDGHDVVGLGRAGSNGATATIDVANRSLDLSAPGGGVESFDVVYQLLGAPLVPRRWGPRRLEAIRSSRLTTTDILARAVAKAPVRPTFVVGCAIGYYGLRGPELLDEGSASGEGLIADLCRAWERAAAPASDAGARVVLARSGIVLGAVGGAIRQQLPIFRLGLGARLGSGRQWTSWISLQDEVRALRFVADTEAIAGPVNLVAPNPVTNAEFTTALAEALGKRAALVVPVPALYAAVGKVTSEEFLLASQRVVPRVLQAHGFEFDHPTLEMALAAVVADIGRPVRP